MRLVNDQRFTYPCDFIPESIFYSAFGICNFQNRFDVLPKLDLAECYVIMTAKNCTRFCCCHNCGRGA
ncbi:MAG: hypothetical protein LBC74_16415 [Planctomycetaceae bacterium]|nr:hypothetical protein [Planctomycetaceae bacterium]